MARTSAPSLVPAWSDVLVLVAGHGLPTERTPPVEPLPAASWEELLRTVQLERLTGLLNAAIEDGTVPATAEQREAAVAVHRHATYLNLALEGVLVEAVELLGRSAIDHRVLKGPSIARLDNAEPGLRCFTDVDLLVPSGQLDLAVARLAEAGLERSDRQLRAGFDQRFGKGASLLGPEGFAVDVHRTLVRGPFGVLVRLEDLWEDPEPFVVAGHELRALPAELRLLNVCFHAALGDLPPRLGPLRDVAELALGGRAADARVLELAASWRAEAVVVRALTLAWSALGLTTVVPLVEWARQRTPSRWDRRMVEHYLDPGRSRLANALTMVRVIPGSRSKAAYVRAITFPDRGYLGDRGVGTVGHWRRLRLPWRHPTPWGRDDESPWGPYDEQPRVTEGVISRRS
jgi:hypothetical protein